jgi:hypothetical protein
MTVPHINERTTEHVTNRMLMRSIWNEHRSWLLDAHRGRRRQCPTADEFSEQREMATWLVAQGDGKWLSRTAIGKLRVDLDGQRREAPLLGGVPNLVGIRVDDGNPSAFASGVPQPDVITD